MKVDKKTQDKIVKMYSDGLSTVEIGKIENLSHEAVRYHLKKRGVILRTGGQTNKIRTFNQKSKVKTKTKIPLSNNMFALIDEEDFEKLNQYNWSLSRERKKNYAFRKDENSRTIRMHREILDVPPSLQIDHINGDGLDNRKENLRIVTNRQNQQNKHVKYTSRYPGVHLDKSRNKWVASIRINGKKKYLGRFDSEEDAYKVYKNEVEKIGERVIE